jgi:hypothetical protein
MTTETKAGPPAPVRTFEHAPGVREAQRAFQRGDELGILQALARDLPALTGDGALDVSALPVSVQTLLGRITNMAIELRRENVAVIGDHEAFVRRGKDGSLHQVIRPVRLSKSDGSIMQIMAKRPIYVEGHKWAGQQVRDTKATPKNEFEWKEVVLGDARKATVLYPGFLKMNAVAGCAVGQPPSVMVDGKQRTNPYVDREVRPDGRPGAIRRIVIQVVVVGPAPATGNPVVVNYTLDYDPSTDLQHMLGKISEELPDEVFLCPEGAPLPDGARAHEWGYQPIAEGIGYRFNLRTKAVAETFREYVNIQANALKKAQTVARRNAMKAHPAFMGLHSVAVNDRGEAVVAITGWAGDQRAMERYASMQDRLSRGQELPTEVDVIDATEAYDPDQHGVTGDDEPGTTLTAPTHEEEAEDAERGALIEYIDNAMMGLGPSQAQSLKYNPGRMSIDELRAIRDKIDHMLDAKT